MSQDHEFMAQALLLARRAFDHQEVPVGAVVVQGGQVIGRGWNHSIEGCDATAHAEIQAIRDAGKTIQNYRLPGATLYVTIEPCVMCVGAMIHARIERLVYGATEPKGGAIISQLKLGESRHWNHQLACCGGVMQSEASELMRSFFRQRREKKKALKQLARQSFGNGQLDGDLDG